jgi:hypothetical protein
VVKEKKVVQKEEEEEEYSPVLGFRHPVLPTNSNKWGEMKMTASSSFSAKCGAPRDV